HRRPEQGLRPPGGFLRGRPRRDRAAGRSDAGRVHPGAGGRARGRGRRGAGRRGRGSCAVPPEPGAGGRVPPRALRRPAPARAVSQGDVMSGHSKWASIKHKKGAADKARGKLFAKLIRQLEVAAREGGGDIEANPTLRTMFQKARDASVPMDTIDRAIKRGTGALEGVRYEPMSFEGYAPAGVAVIVEALSDN